MKVPAPLRKESGEDARRRFKPYPAYKDSGIEWLGRVPAHWEVRRLKTVASVHLSNVDKKSYEGQEPVLLCNYTHVYNNERITPDLDFMPATATTEQLRRLSLREGDVLITKDSESWTDIAVPSLVTSGHWEGILCGYHLAIVRAAAERTGAFLARAFSAIGPRDQFHVAANGITRFALGSDAIRTALFAIPPANERHAIAAFLDRETARVDALIAKKERLIELLQERRLAFIHRAVAKGLDARVPIRDSGIPSLGDVPTHWDLVRVGRYADVVNGSTPHRETPEYWFDGTHPWLTSRRVNDEVVIAADEFVTDVALRQCHLPLVPADSVLIAITGEGQTRGKAALLRIPTTVSQHLAAITPRDDRLLAEYVWRVFQSQYDRLRTDSGGIGSTRGALTCEYLRSFVLPVPPFAEQVRIANVIRAEDERLGLLMRHVHSAVSHLEELRTALVSAAVTGKIDVREQAAA